MAESRDDKDVDACIADVQAALDRLKAAQRKDVRDEDGDGYPEPKNLKEAEQKAHRLRRAGRESSDEPSEK